MYWLLTDVKMPGVGCRTLTRPSHFLLQHRLQMLQTPGAFMSAMVATRTLLVTHLLDVLSRNNETTGHFMLQHH